MKAKVTKIDKCPSRVGNGSFYWIFFKGVDGHGYRTHVVPNFGNFSRWYSVIVAWNNLQEMNNPGELWLDGLQIIGDKKMIDADSVFTMEVINKNKKEDQPMETIIQPIPQGFVEKVVCPYCGHIQSDDFNRDVEAVSSITKHVGMEDVEAACAKCNGIMIISRMVNTYYKTIKRKQGGI